MITNPWKSIFILLGISALAVAGHGFAQQGNGSPDGLYAVPDAGGSSSQESTSKRAAQSYLSSLDPQGERFKHDLERVDATRKAASSAKELAHVAEGDFPTAPSTQSRAEQITLAVLAGIAILVSLAAGGFVWWSRAQSSTANRAILLAVQRKPAVKFGDAEKQDQPPKRRAA